MKKAVGVLLGLAIAGGAGGGLYYHYIYNGNNNAVMTASDEQDTVYVNSVSMLAGLNNASGLMQRYAGVVEPQETWSAKLENDKTVKETYVEVGDTVKKGDKLFIYSTVEDQNNLEKNDIEIEHTKNDILTAQKTLEQYKKNKAAAKTQEDVLEWETQILQIENQIKQDEYDLKERDLDKEKYQYNIDNAVVYSQLDGVVKSINSGNSSSMMDDGSGSDAYITIMAVGDYRIKVKLNEQNVSSVDTQQPMIVYSRVDSKQFWKGTVSKVDTENGTSNANSDYDSGDSSTNSTNYAFYVKLDSSEGLLLGQHVYLEPDVGQTEQREGIWLPDYYFNEAEDGSFWVWAATDRNILEKRSVVLGTRDDELGEYQVEAGLTADDYIVQDQPGLTEGSVVTKIDYAASSDDYYSDGAFEEYGDGSLGSTMLQALGLGGVTSSASDDDDYYEDEDSFSGDLDYSDDADFSMDYDAGDYDDDVSFDDGDFDDGDYDGGDLDF